jgi:hypothetical protein
MSTDTHIVLKLCVRNDGSPPHRVPNIERFASRDEAIQSCIISLIGHAGVGTSDDTPELREKLYKTLDSGVAIWVWEWRRKGNGDLFYVGSNVTGSDMDVLLYHNVLDSGGDCKLIDSSVDWRELF